MVELVGSSQRYENGAVPPLIVALALPSDCPQCASTPVSVATGGSNTVTVTLLGFMLINSPISVSTPVFGST